MIEFSNLIEVSPIDSGVGSQPRVYEFIADTFSYIPQLSLRTRAEIIGIATRHS